MKLRLIITAASVFTGCAPSPAAEGKPGPARSSRAMPATRWTANIQSVTESRSDISQPQRARSYGSATMTQAQHNNLTSVSITFTHTGPDRFLNWAIYSGSCGSSSLPMLAITSFPELQVGGGGRAVLTADLPLEFPMNGSFYVNIYRERQQSLEGLIACGNFRGTET